MNAGADQFSNDHIRITVVESEEEIMLEVGGEGVEQLAGYFAQLSERQAANARILFQEIERRRDEAREQGRNFAAPTTDQILDRLQDRKR